MTHTPGKWLYNDAESRIETDEADAVSLALIYCDDRKYRANARLIAAAPDLLEALDVFAELLGWEDPVLPDDEVTVKSGPTTDHTVKGRHILAARAAIAKARGETA